MSALFVSGIPRAVLAGDAEQFLQGAFPQCAEVVLLRAAAGTHKGHAYVHFHTTEAARAALEAHTGANDPLTLGSDASVLRLRLTSHGRRTERSHRSSVECAPLPAAFLDHPFGRCAVVDLSEDAGTEDAHRHAAVLRETNGTLLAPPAEVCMGDGRRVVLFASDEACNAAVERFPAVLTRCGPPRLDDILGASRRTPIPRSGAHAEESGRKRQREDDSPNYEPRHRRAEPSTPLVPVSPAETLRILENYFQGQNCVAVADGTGAVALFRLPAYAAGFL